MAQENSVSNPLERLGTFLLRYGLVVVIAWIGAMKFTAYEANGIQPMVANSPLLGWVYGIISVTTFAKLLGIVEIIIAIMIALRAVSAKISGIGSLLAAGMFLTTLSFIISTPGWESGLGGFPALSVVPGQFLLKDVVLLGAALWTAGEAFSNSTSASFH